MIFLGEAYSCSRSYLIKLLENNEIEYRKIGKHRRILLKDVLNYREKMKAAQKQAIIDIMEADEKDGLYHT